MAPECDGHGTAPHGRGHGPELPELREHWDASLRHSDWVLGGPAWSRGLDKMIIKGPSQLGIFPDSVIL